MIVVQVFGSRIPGIPSGQCVQPAIILVRPKLGQNRTTLGVIEMLQTGTHFKPRVERRHLNLAPCDVAKSPSVW